MSVNLVTANNHSPQTTCSLRRIETPQYAIKLTPSASDSFSATKNRNGLKVIVPPELKNAARDWLQKEADYNLLSVEAASLNTLIISNRERKGIPSYRAFASIRALANRFNLELKYDS
jgi:hypothetical protein